MRFRTWIWLLINMLAMYGKSLPTGPYEVLSMDLAINLKSLIAPLAPGEMIYPRLCVTAGARHHSEGAGVQKLQMRRTKTLHRRTSARSFQARLLSFNLESI